MKNIFVLLCCFLFSNCYSQELPNLTTEQNEIKDLVWNKWDTKNFIILSLDYNQGIYLKNNIEDIKKSIFEKWNLRNIDFSSECKIICVNDKEMLSKLFKINEPRIELRPDKDNKIYLSVLWFFMDEKNDFPKDKLAEICVSHLEQQSNKKMPLFLKKGICSLSDDVDKIKKNLLHESILKVDVNNLFKINQENFDKLSDQDREKFINQSSSLVLLFRKEYGKDNFNNYINNDKFFDIDNNDKLNNIINRYNKYLLEDLKKNRVPDEYLEIKGGK